MPGKVERLIYWGVALTLFLGAFTLTLMRLGTGSPTQTPQQADPAPTALGIQAEAVVHYLLDNGHVARTEISVISPELAGLSLTEVTKLRPEWTIVSFSEQRVVASRPCPPTDGPGGFVAEEDGVIAIFAGDPDGCHAVREITEIPVDTLPSNLRTTLAEGVPFHHEADLPQILDGLRSTR